MIRFSLLALVLATPVMAQVPVPDLSGLPPDIAALVRKDVASINQLATSPFPKMVMPAPDFPAGFPAFPAFQQVPAFQPLPAFPVFPAGPGSYSYSTSTSSADEWSLANDRFRLKFSDNGTSVKVCGKLIDGKPVLDEIVMQEGRAGEKVFASADDLPVTARKRMLEMLDSKLAR